MTKYAYSVDQEVYYGEFDSRQDALAAGKDCAEGGVVWTAEIKQGIEYLDAQSVGAAIVEMLDEQLSDDIRADDAILELRADLCEKLGKQVLSFLRINAEWNAWGVKNVHEAEADDEDELPSDAERKESAK